MFLSYSWNLCIIILENKLSWESMMDRKKQEINFLMKFLRILSFLSL